MDEPDAIACDGRAFGIPFGVYALACVVSGGSGEAPQPPDTKRTARNPGGVSDG